MRIKYNYRRSFSYKIELKMNKNRKNPKKILTCPKKHKKIVACPIQFCKKNGFWPVLWPVLISDPPVVQKKSGPKLFEKTYEYCRPRRFLRSGSVQLLYSCWTFCFFFNIFRRISSTSKFILRKLEFSL